MDFAMQQGGRMAMLGHDVPDNDRHLSNTGK